MPTASIWSPDASLLEQSAGTRFGSVRGCRRRTGGIDLKAFEGEERSVAWPMPSWSLVPPISMPSTQGCSHRDQRAPAAPLRTASLAEKRR